MMKRVVLLCIYSICFWPTIFNYPPVFRTLHDAQLYAKNMEEFPPIGNTAWENPDFSSFLKKNVPTWWDVLSYKIHRKSWPAWHIWGFKDLLVRVTNARESNGYMGRFVVKMHPVPKTKFVIWGDIQGAYHSLVRDLTELYNWEIINESFKIISPNYYFVFMGNVIDRSAYSLEVLTLLLRLMEENPDRVFYLRGNHEDYDLWKNYGLKQELIIKAAQVSRERIPLNTEIDRLFNTLPLALYLVAKETDKEIDIFRFSNADRSSSELNEDKFKGFFEASNINQHIFKLHSTLTVQSVKKITMPAIIKGEHHSIIYRPTPGLAQLDSDKGATAWTILSSPTESYRYLQDFYYDAFAILDVKQNINDWSISLYNQDVRELLGFKKVATYNVITGLSESEGTEQETDTILDLKYKVAELHKKISTLEQECLAGLPVITDHRQERAKKPQAVAVGTLLDLSKVVKDIGKDVRDGLQVAINKANHTGIDHKKIQLVVYDDGYDPVQTRKAVNDFLTKYDSGILLSSIGTPTLLSYFDLVKQQKVLVLFPITGFPLFYNAALKHMILFRPSYSQELAVVARHIIKKHGIQKLAIVYQNDDSGKVPLADFEQMLAKEHITNIVKVPYDKDQTDFFEQISMLKRENPQEICFLAIPFAAQQVVAGLGVDFLKEKYLFGWSDLNAKIFSDFVKERGISFLFVNVVPGMNNELEIVNEYKQAMKVHNLTPNTFSFESFINATIFVYLMKQIPGVVSQDALIKAAEDIKHSNVKGLDLHFDVDTRQLSHTIWMNEGTDDWKAINITE